MNRLVTSQGTLLEDFETIGEWSIFNGTGTVTDDTTYYRTGAHGIRIESLAGVAVVAAKNIGPWDMSDMQNIRFSVYVEEVDKLSGINVYLSNGTMSTTNSLYCNLTSAGLKTGWNEMVVAKGSFIQRGTGNWTDPILCVLLRVLAKTGVDCWVTWDTLRRDYVGTPVVMIDFDDGYASQHSLAFPILSGNGQKANIYAYTDAVGTTDHMVESQYADLDAAGWDILNHGGNHDRFTDLTAAEIAEQLDIASDYWQLLLGASRNPEVFLAFPGGETDADVTAAVQDSGVLLARTCIYPFGSQAHIELTDDLPWYVKAFSVQNVTSVATLTGYIDNLIAEGGLLVLLFHNIVTSGADTTIKFLASNLQLVSDYIKAKEDAGLLRCMTASEYYSYIEEATDTKQVVIQGNLSTTHIVEGHLPDVHEDTVPGFPSDSRAYWSMDEGGGAVVGDEDGGYDGELIAGSWITGPFGGALRFNGSTDYVQIANATVFDPRSRMSVSLWYRTSALMTGKAAVARDSATYKWLITYFSASSGSIYHYIRQASGTTYAGWAGGAALLADGEWHHAVMTFDRWLSSERLKLYFDGVEKATADCYNEEISDGSEGVQIGKWTNYFQGDVAEVRYYNRTLTVAEVQLLYECGRNAMRRHYLPISGKLRCES
jgi:peptidoglycan/xylan/chitin deacetylase (PgdA/CDA1 family)